MTLQSLVSLTGDAGLVTALVALAGGLLLFVAGRSRGALPGAGLVVLAAGMLAGFLPFPPPSWIAARLHLGEATAGWLYSGVLLLLTLGGWALVLAALFRFRFERPDAPGGYPPQPPGGNPPPPYGGQPGPYGPPGNPPVQGQGHIVPGPDPEEPPSGPGAGDDRPNPGWGGPPYGTEGPPPPPGY